MDLEFPDEPEPSRFVEFRAKEGQLIRFSASDIIDQGKCLCGHYIRSRLRRRGIMNRKALQRLRTHGDATATVAPIIQDVFPIINGMGDVLEKMHPKVYSDVARQLSCAPFEKIGDGDNAAILLSTFARNLFQDPAGQPAEINWSKIISFFAVAGGLASDCVKHGHYDYLPRLVEVCPSIIHEYILDWLMENGGWLGLIEHMKELKSKPKDNSLLSFLYMAVGVLATIYFGSKLLESIGQRVYSYFVESDSKKMGNSSCLANIFSV